MEHKNMSSNQNTNNTWRLIGAILLILLLLLLWMMGRGPGQAGCCGDAAPAVPVAAAPVAPIAAPALVPAKVNAAWDGSKITLTGEVASDADKKRIVDAAIAAYGAGNVVDQLTVKAGLGALAGITLTGIVPSDAEKTARGDAATKAFAPLGVDNQLVVQAPVAAAPAEKAPDCSKAMELRVQFATNKADITSEGKRYLDNVVKCVTGPMLVGGHTDNRGGDAINMPLSQARADAVKAYLLSKGVKDALLGTQGFAASKPIADNATAQGRARNRRIELTAK
jgi:OmpA-OmpF porin, OOP family